MIFMFIPLLMTPFTLVYTAVLGGFLALFDKCLGFTHEVENRLIIVVLVVEFILLILTAIFLWKKITARLIDKKSEHSLPVHPTEREELQPFKF